MFQLLRASMLAALFVVLNAAAANVALADSYNVIDLGPLRPASVNNLGQVFGTVTTNRKSRAYVYDKGELTDLGVLPNFEESFAIKGNDRGQVLGESFTQFLDDIDPIVVSSASLYTGGGLQALGVETAGAVRDLNNVGQILVGEPSGSYILANGLRTDVRLAPPGFDYGDPVAVNDLGQVAGVAGIFSAGVLRAVIAGNDGSLLDLGTLGGNQSRASDINNSGQVVGSSTLTAGSGITHAFLYSNGAMQDLGTLPGDDFSIALAMNNRGDVIGTSGGILRVNQSFLYRDGAMVSLNSLIAADSGWQLSSAIDINDAGQIVGYGFFRGEGRTFLLTPNAQPVPEPFSMLLMGTGLAGVAGATYRKKRKASA